MQLSGQSSYYHDQARWRATGKALLSRNFSAASNSKQEHHDFTEIQKASWTNIMDIGYPPQNHQIGGGREPSKPWHKQRGNSDARETSTCAFLRCGSLKYWSLSVWSFSSVLIVNDFQVLLLLLQALPLWARFQVRRKVTWRACIATILLSRWS